MTQDIVLAQVEPPPPQPRRATVEGQVLFYVGLGLLILAMVPVGFVALWPLAAGSAGGFAYFLALGTVAACTLTAPLWFAAVIVEWLAKRRASRREWSWVLIVSVPIAGLGATGVTAMLGSLVLAPRLGAFLH